MPELARAQIEIIQIPVGVFRANCYLIFCSESRKAVIVDPGDEGESILQTIRELKLEPEWILLTHGHGDHIGAVGFLKNSLNLKVAIHWEEANMLIDARANLSILFGESILASPADRLFRDGDTFNLDDRTITVLHTPGHSPGGSSFLLDRHVFTGDALFKETVGRTDFPGSSHSRLIKGIREKILTLDDDVTIYPGHGPTSTVGEERRNNPYLREIA